MSGSGVLVNLSQYLGDLICQIPLLMSLRHAYPGPVHIFAKHARARLLHEAGCADHCHDDQGLDHTTRAACRALTLDRLINARPRSLRASWFCARTGCPQTRGFASLGNRLLLHEVAARDPGLYRPYEYLRLAGAAAITPITAMNRIADPHETQPAEPSLLVIPRFHLPHKFWGRDNLLTCLRSVGVRHPDLRFLIHAGPDEIEAASDLAEALWPRAEVLSAPTLRRLASVALNARAALLFDSGPSHIAFMSGLPVVALFSNERGTGAGVLQGYFDRRPGACAIIAADQRPLHDYPVAPVCTALDRALTEPAYAAVIDILT